MGQKSHPRGLRLGIIEGWDSKWYASHDYAALLHEDLKLRDFIKRRLYHAGISRVEIDKLKTDIQKMMKGKDAFINIHEVRRPDLDPQLVAENIALQLERRVAFRRAMKEAVLRAMRMGAQGVKVHVAGRLGGAEIARREWYREGRVPLQTLRADVAYGFAEAHTTYGQIGVKVWIFRGEVLTRKDADAKRAGAPAQAN